MSIVGNLDTPADAPNYKIEDHNAANGQVMYGNVTVGAFTSNLVEGVYGITSAEMPFSNNSNVKLHGGHAGWNLIRRGTGPVANINISNSGINYAPSDFVTVYGNGAVNATANLVLANTGPVSAANVANSTDGGTGYSNTDYVIMSGGTVNATMNISTNTTGGIVSTSNLAGGNGFANSSVVVFHVSNSTNGNSAGSNATFSATINTTPGYIIGFSNLVGGSGFANGAYTIKVSNSTNGTANGTEEVLTVTLGGRAGRTQVETLVAMGSISNTANSAPLPPL